MSATKWRCFHCNDVFTSRRFAAEHFGSDESKTPACKIKSYEGHLVTYIRDLESQLDGYRAEDSHVLRSIYTMEADHRRAVIQAEEIGYNRGVRDMTAEAERAIKTCPSLDANGYVCEKSEALKALNA